MSSQSQNDLQAKLEKYLKQNHRLAKELKKYKNKCENFKSMLDQYKDQFENLSEKVETFGEIYGKINEELNKIQTKKNIEKKEELTNQMKTNFTLEYYGEKQTEKDMILVSVKRLEELENSYYEICKNFDLLKRKYLWTKEDKVGKEEVTQKFKEIEELNEKYTKLEVKLQETYEDHERLEKINKCVINISLAGYSHEDVINLNKLNSRGNEIEDKEPEDDKKEKYTEPMPSFLKFLNN